MRTCTECGGPITPCPRCQTPVCVPCTEPEPMESSRVDGRGHWPKGRRRNGELTVPKGCPYKTVGELLADIWDYATANCLKSAIAEYLGVTPSAVYRWSTGENQMDQSSLDATWSWFQEQELKELASS